MKESQEEIWDKIAAQWAEFRKVPFPDVVEFIKRNDNPNSRILDLGCGSGRNFIKTKARLYALDFSSEMLKLAEKKIQQNSLNITLIKSSADTLPFESNFFDAAIFIATLHCLDSEKKRENALKELHRVLKKGARAFITVWDKNQEKFKNSEKEIHLAWTTDTVSVIRYYYLYDKDEIQELLEDTGFKIISIEEKDERKDKRSKRNIIIEVEKST